jgi:uncharacterized protein (UPF0128 family)
MSTNRTITKPETEKYSTQLPSQQIKWVKREALGSDLKDYKVVTVAIAVLKCVIDQDVPLPVELLPADARRILDNLKAGKQETLIP